MGRYTSDARERTTVLLNQLRNAVPSRQAEHLGRLDPYEALAIVEAYLYIRRQRLAVPISLYREIQQHVLQVLDTSEGFDRPEPAVVAAQAAADGD